jgi:hypothetical protein
VSLSLSLSRGGNGLDDRCGLRRRRRGLICCGRGDRGGLRLGAGYGRLNLTGGRGSARGYRHGRGRRGGDHRLRAWSYGWRSARRLRRGGDLGLSNRTADVMLGGPGIACVA